MNGHAVDFLRPRRAPALGWWVAALGCGVLLLAIGLDRHWQAQRAAREAALEQQQEALLKARAVARRPAVPTADERRLRHVALQVQQPWLPMLRAIEGVTLDPVYLLSMTVDPAAGRVQLEAEAPSFDQALVYVQRLDEDGALGPAQITAHETRNDPATGRTGVHFTVVTQWKARR